MIVFDGPPAAGDVENGAFLPGKVIHRDDADRLSDSFSHLVAGTSFFAATGLFLWLLEAIPLSTVASDGFGFGIGLTCGFCVNAKRMRCILPMTAFRVHWRTAPISEDEKPLSAMRRMVSILSSVQNTDFTAPSPNEMTRRRQVVRGDGHS